MFTNTILRYFRYIGVAMVLMLAFMLGRCSLKKWEDWKYLLLCLPVFTYNFGTMLLLTGTDYRFFLMNFLVCPVVIAMMLNKTVEKDIELKSVE